MGNFLTLNRDLRTDQYGIITLLDNVPSTFSLEDANDECHYAFPINYDLNPKGTIRIRFQSSKPVQVFVSDWVRKPSHKDADKVLTKIGELYRYTPVHNNVKSHCGTDLL